MATIRFIGTAPAVAQVNSETIGASVEVGDEFYLRLENKDGVNHEIGFTATATTQANVAAGLHAAAAAAKTAATVPWNGVTTADASPVVTITGDTAGEPFWVTARTVNVSEGVDDQTLTDAAVTACAGPHIYNTAENWDNGARPVHDTDTVILPAGVSVDIYGYDDSAIALKGFTIEEGFTGVIGSRDRPLKLLLLVSSTYYDFTNRSTQGTKYISLKDWGDAYIEGAPPAPGVGQYGLYLTGTMDASSVTDGYVYVNAADGASIGLGPNKGDECDFNDIFVIGGDVTVGPDLEDDDGAHSTLITMRGGVVHNYGELAGGLLQYSGTVYQEASATCAACSVYEPGTLYWNNGTMTLLNIYGRATVDCRESQILRTATTLHFYGDGGTFYDPTGAVTHTNPFELHNTQLSKITFDGPINKKYTVGVAS